MKVSELTGAQLDYWVARAQGWSIGRPDGNGFYYPTPTPEGLDHWIEQGAEVEFREVAQDWKPSSNWLQGGAIIEREGIAPWKGVRFASADSAGNVSGWYATHPATAPSAYSGKSCYIDVHDTESSFGETPLIAAMRAYVASKFGEEVPD